ncbi:MAG: bifunctional hydroxymethylpyrimidine kinase/phosphomethylpyrimidine kinase [Smithellaceae bacterium]|nr:bifunctional hydroxymethylpyrimidine kinase/phosphomethylpyrimidine kinase [Smithellaceae bacterium]
MTVNPKRILTIAGSDSGGGAGIQADLKTITALGGFGMSAITALTAQNTLGVQGIYEIPADFVKKQITSVVSDIGVDAVKTGMLANAENTSAVAAMIREFRIELLVVDPVMRAKGGASLIREEAVRTMVKELIPLAYLLTPNIPEAELLAGMKINKIEHMKQAAQAIRRLGPKNVLVKGGHLDESYAELVDVLYDGVEFHEFSAPRIDTRDTHGTGCTYSAALATLLAGGLPLPLAVREAKEYITEAIRRAFRLGAGHGPTNHLAPLLRDLWMGR